MYDEFEAGFGQSDHVKVEIKGKDDQTFVLDVNPVGQFDPGGCLAFISLKKDQLLSLNSTEELYEMLLNRIFFENLEIAYDADNYSLKSVLEYTGALEVDDENSWWLNYFKRLADRVNKFKDGLFGSENRLEDLVMKVHEYHEANGEACDFADYTCCPEGGSEEELRDFFESSLSPESEIDAIMEHFEDGYFYGDGFAADQLTIVSFGDRTFSKSLTISDVR